jgi:hypothetical protein
MRWKRLVPERWLHRQFGKQQRSHQLIKLGIHELVLKFVLELSFELFLELIRWF